MDKKTHRYYDIKLRKEELDILKNKNDLIRDDLETKNRVDVSLKEYEEMKKKIEDLTSENSYYKKVFEQLKLDKYLYYLDLNDVDITTYEMFEQNKEYVRLRILLKKG